MQFVGRSSISIVWNDYEEEEAFKYKPDKLLFRRSLDKEPL